MTNLIRTIAGAPGAMIVTAGLGLLMAGMIKVEYEAMNDNPEKLSFIINETPPEIDVVRTTDIPVLATVETPPPPPVLDTDRVDLPPTEHVELTTEPPVIIKPTIRMDDIAFEQSDGDARPLVRIPPIMPPRFAEGNNSGRCTVRFDVSAEGSPFNVEITSCSNDMLKRPTVKSVLKWRYQPKIVNGQATKMSGVQDVIVFQLLDANGKRLPEA